MVSNKAVTDVYMLVLNKQLQVFLIHYWLKKYLKRYKIAYLH